jgi:hypothetical protein
MEIVAEEFADIIRELQKTPLQVNHYRGCGVGRSQVFGVVNRRCLVADYSRWSWKRPYLYKLLLDFAAKHVKIPFTSITVNQNYTAEPHKDKHNIGESFLVAFGEYTGGELKIHEGELEGVHNIRYKPIVADFSKITHSVLPFEGYRLSLVFYTNKGHRKGDVEIPAPSVKQENGKWVFYRGTERIEANVGLPHPLKGFKKRVVADATSESQEDGHETGEESDCSS